MQPRTARPLFSLASRLAAWGVVALSVVLGLVGVVAAPSASAHSRLVSSTPADGSTLEAMPKQVVFEFNEDINEQFAQIVFAGADGTARSAQAEVDGPEVTAGVPSGLQGPEVTARYRVVSSDGHPISGEITFEVPEATNSPSTPGAAASTSGPSTSGASTGDATSSSSSQAAVPTDPASTPAGDATQQNSAGQNSTQQNNASQQGEEGGLPIVPLAIVAAFLVLAAAAFALLRRRRR